jgi:hypothetical protein
MAKTAIKAAAKPAQTAKPATKPQTASRATTNASRAPVEPERRTAPQTPAVRPSAPPPSTETINQLPAFMRNDVDLGKENIGRDDMDMPRLKLMQGLSKELTLYDDLKAGHFFHSAAEMIFDEPFRVVPIYFDRQFILWRPLEAGGGIIARAPDGVHWQPSSGEVKTKLDRKDGGHEVTWKWDETVDGSGLAAWGTMNPNDLNSPPAATLMYNFLLAFPDHPELMPAVLTFQRSSIKIGRKFNTKLKTVRTPLFGSVFTLSSYDDHNAANQDFKNINITGSGMVQDAALYDSYKNLHLAIAKSGLNIKDVDTLQGDPENTEGNAPEGQPGY